MEEKRYLKWYNKVGYGAGDIAGNVVYALLSAFVMIFLTDTVGMNAGVVGTLIAVSNLFDGVSEPDETQEAEQSCHSSAQSRPGNPSQPTDV